MALESPGTARQASSAASAGDAPPRVRPLVRSRVAVGPVGKPMVADAGESWPALASLASSETAITT
jgi:hypothetical protein